MLIITENLSELFLAILHQKLEQLLFFPSLTLISAPLNKPAVKL